MLRLSPRPMPVLDHHRWTASSIGSALLVTMRPPIAPVDHEQQARRVPTPPPQHHKDPRFDPVSQHVNASVRTDEEEGRPADRIQLPERGRGDP